MTEPRETSTDLPHTAWGAPHCAGNLSTITTDDRAEIICGECGHVVVRVPVADLPATLHRMENTRLTTLPHSSFGDDDCCGCLEGFMRGDEADVICGECGALIRTVPTADLERTFSELELTLDFVSEICPHCGKANVMFGFSAIMAYTSRECGRVVRLADDPDVERLFGPENGW